VRPCSCQGRYALDAEHDSDPSADVAVDTIAGMLDPDLASVQ
jgi:hypothetical protein